MPGTTPIYGFTYPCNGDPINVSSFQTLANQIDTQLQSVQLDENYALGRYVHVASVANQAGIAPGVETPLTNAGAVYTVLAAGLYVVSVGFFLINTTTLDSTRVRVRRNVTPVFGNTLNNNANLSFWSNTVGMVQAVAGDTINPSVFWVGTGVGTMANLRVTVRQAVRIV